MIPALDPDSESFFIFLVIPYPDSDPVRIGMVTPIKRYYDSGLGF